MTEDVQENRVERARGTGPFAYLLMIKPFAERELPSPSRWPSARQLVEVIRAWH